MIQLFIKNIILILQFIVFIWIILSYTSFDNRFSRIINNLGYIINKPAEKVFEILGLGRGPINLSPILTIIFLNLIEALLFKLLYA